MLGHFERLGAAAVGFSRTAGKGFRAYEELPAALSGAESVVHCAAVTRFFGDRDEIMRVNGEWPVELYRQANQAGVPSFIFISSIAVHGYWNRDPDTITDETPVGDRRSRMSDYGLAKCVAEEGLRRAADRTCLVILRPGIIYDEYTHERLRASGPQPVWRAEQRLPYVHADNVCHAVSQALRAGGSGTYLLVDGEQPNVLQYYALFGIPFRPVPAYKRRLLSWVRTARAVVRGRREILRGLRHEEDCQSRRIVYVSRRIRTDIGYIPVRRLEDALPSGREDVDETVFPKAPRMRLAAVGLGSWGRRLVAEAVGTGRFDIVALCDPVLEESSKPRCCRDVPVFRTVQDLVGSTQCDGVLVCTPNFLHAENVAMLSPHVRQIYLEKPMGRGIEDRRLIEECVDKSGAGLTVGYALGQSSGARRVRELAGSLGRITGARLVRTLARDYPSSDWRTDPERCPGGVIAQLGVHLFDLAIEVLGGCEFDAVNASSRLPNGQVWACSWRGRAGESKLDMRAAFAEANAFELRVEGERGFVALADGNLAWRIGRDEGSRPVDLEDGSPAMLKAFYRSWLNLRRGIAPKALQVEACYERSLRIVQG